MASLGEPAYLPDKLGHFHDPNGVGRPGWGQSQRWQMAGQTPSVSVYDDDQGANDSNFHNIFAAGLRRVFGRAPLSAPTMTRRQRNSAQLVSLPAARFFQSYDGAGTGQNWSGGAVAVGTRQSNINWNPAAPGAAELHPATTYDPFPSPGSLYPKVV